MKVYIGYDTKQDIAYRVCRSSLLKNVNAEVIPLNQNDLRSQKTYTREIDPLSSTEFTFTRFLVPFLTNYQGWAVFVDCDFLFIDDISELFKLADEKYAVMVVKHNYNPSVKIKMDGQLQFSYPRKNWSSLILWNCSHPSNQTLSTEVINTVLPAYLHRFAWLADEEIGELDLSWNWLVNWYSEPQDGSPKAVHYTEGGPWLENYKNCEYSQLWFDEKDRMLRGTDDYTDNP